MPRRVLLPAEQPEFPSSGSFKRFRCAEGSCMLRVNNEASHHAYLHGRANRRGAEPGMGH
jgi:hypothetical protein